VFGVDVTDQWLTAFEGFCTRIGPRFGRAEPRSRAGLYLRGLSAGLDRRNGWTIAEHAGQGSPDGMQRLLRLADFDVDGVRDDLRELVVDQFGDPDAVLVIDDTGFVKKGRHSAGVQRQYSGTAGRTENCQIGVFLAYVAPAGHTLIDRRLYLPESWTNDRARCRQAGIPDEVAFATKPRLAIEMIQQVLAAGVPFGWFAADEAYGHAAYLRDWLEEQAINHVVAVQSNDEVRCRDARARRVDELTAALPPRTWRRRSAGDGAHGPRLYDWARVQIRPTWRHGAGHWMLARRSISDPPARTTLATLVRVAGRRWPVEECFQQAKNETGLDEYQVRDWRAWYAHITLSMAAHALLAIARTLAAQANPTRPPRN
jgi:SRSO17 transposase